MDLSICPARCPSLPQPPPRTAWPGNPACQWPSFAKRAARGTHAWVQALLHSHYLKKVTIAEKFKNQRAKAALKHEVSIVTHTVLVGTQRPVILSSFSLKDPLLRLKTTLEKAKSLVLLIFLAYGKILEQFFHCNTFRKTTEVTCWGPVGNVWVDLVNHA